MLGVMHTAIVLDAALGRMILEVVALIEHFHTAQATRYQYDGLGRFLQYWRQINL